ncbi:MAG: hypothetical protein AABY22_16165, partial [Nanoarchaeota archaeon]
VGEGKTFYTLSASTRGSTLLQTCKLNNRLLRASIERNPEKVGKVYSSLQIPIISEEQARKDNPNFMFLLPWFFQEEIIKREQEYLQKNGSFLIPLPKPKIISKDEEVVI